MTERTGEMATMAEIEELAGAYAEARGLLGFQVDGLQREIEILKKRRLRAIRKALARTAEAESRLRAAIEESPEIFRRPRTQVFHGVRVGYKKGKGSIMWDDAAAVVRRIKDRLPEQAELLVRTVESPNKQALSELPAAELRRLGVTVTETGDEVVIRPVDGDVEKLVAVLLKDTYEDLMDAI